MDTVAQGYETVTDKLHFSDLADAFTFSATRSELTGIEVEIAVLDPQTGTAVPYCGAGGIETLLRAILRKRGGEPIMDGAVLVGIQERDGIKISIENGGALEYSSRPGPDVVSVMTAAQTDLMQLADIAARIGRALVPGGNYPFNEIGNACWMPISRGDIVRQHFVSLGRQSEWGPEVMALALATQVTLDYTTVADLCRKLPMQARVSPLAAALFVNSPIEAGRPSGVLSRRLLHYSRTDPRRTGMLPPALNTPFNLDDFITWAVDVPMIYHKTNDGYASVGRTFRSVLGHGFDDGTQPAWSDWTAQLSQIWTQVRLRDALELRVMDGPPFAAIPSVPAFWVGLSYHPPSADAALDLLGAYSPNDYRNLLPDVATSGLRARLGSTPVSELARELLDLARQGLAARVAQGLEKPDVLAYLDPLVDVLDSGRTFAEQCLHRWDTDLHCDPRRFVEVYRIPSGPQ
jgi:glutamate--cysteine ligase